MITDKRRRCVDTELNISPASIDNVMQTQKFGYLYGQMEMGMLMEMGIAQTGSQNLFKYFAGDAQIILIFNFYLIFALALLSFALQLLVA